MARPLRLEFPGAIYHVMSRGVARTKTFLEAADYEFFLELVGNAVTDGTLIIHAFALLSNHFHFLAETPLGRLGRWMHKILGHYALRFNLRHGRVGHLWQARYKAILVDDGEYFLECSRYNHLNPDRCKATRPMENYPWSSYHNYFGNRPVVDWVCTQKTLSFFSSPEGYRRFLEEGRGQRLVSPFARATAGFAFGSPEFVDQMRKEVLANEKAKEVDLLGLRQLRRSGAVPSVEQVRSAVACLSSHFTRSQRERVLAFTLSQLTWLKTVEIAKLVGKTPGAVSRIVKDLDQRLSFDPKFALLMEQVCKVIQNGGSG